VIRGSRKVRRYLGSRDFDALVRILLEGTRRERRAAAHALGELGDARAVNPLANALQNAYGEDEDIPPVIVAALGKIDAPSATDALKAALADRRDDRFYFLAHRDALFALADRGVVEPLEQVAEDNTREESLRGEAKSLIDR
jgi:HEAT repeat protein